METHVQLIISFHYLPIIDLSGTFGDQNMVLMAGNRKTTVIAKGIHSVSASNSSPS